MKRFLAIALLLSATACSKPSEDDCRKAIHRIRELQGTATIQGNEDIEAAVRSCKGNAKKESVKCAAEASSLDQLERCGLLSKEDIEAIREEQKAQTPPVPPPAPAADAGAAAVPAADAGAAAAAAADAATVPAADAGAATK